MSSSVKTELVPWFAPLWTSGELWRGGERHFLSPSSHCPKASGKIQNLKAASWWFTVTRPKRKGQTVRKQNICLDTIQRCFLPPTLFPFSNLGLGFPCNYKGCATSRRLKQPFSLVRKQSRSRSNGLKWDYSQHHTTFSAGRPSPWLSLEPLHVTIGRWLDF